MTEYAYLYWILAFVILFSVIAISHLVWKIGCWKSKYEFLSEYLKPTGDLIIAKDEDGSYMFLDLYNENDKLYDGYKAVFKVVIIDDSQK